MYRSALVVVCLLVTSPLSAQSQPSTTHSAVAAAASATPISVEAPNPDGGVISGVNTSSTVGLGGTSSYSGPSGLFGSGSVGVYGTGTVGGWFNGAVTGVTGWGLARGIAGECVESACTGLYGRAGNTAGIGLYGEGNFAVVGKALPAPSGLEQFIHPLAGHFYGDVLVEGGLQAPIIQQLQTDNASLRSDIAALTAQVAALVAFTGTPGVLPRPVPGRVQAEDYDAGGQNVGYSDTTPGNEQGTAVYRNDDVDIKTSTEGGYAIGWMASGEWLAYTVNVQTDGVYTISVRIGSALPGRTFHVEADGHDATGPVSVPQMPDWDQYETVSVTGVSLHAGRQTLRIVVGPDDWMDFQWFEVRSS